MQTQRKHQPQKRKLHIEIQKVYGAEDEAVVAYYARGKYSPKEFVRALMEYGVAIDTSAPGQPQQEFWYVHDAMFRKCEVTQKGAFAVTVLDVEEWER